MSKDKTKLLLKTAITLALLWLIFRNIATDELLTQLAIFNLWYLIPVSALIALFLILGGVNNWLVLRALAPLPLWEAIKVFLISASVGMFTPAYVGEFASMTYLLKKRGINVSEGLSVSTIDKIITLAVNSALFLIGLLLYFPDAGTSVFVLTLLALLVPALCLLAPPLRRAVYAVVQRRFSWAAAYCYSCASFFVHHPVLLMLNVVASVARAIVGALCIWYLLHGFGIDAPLVPVLFMNFVARMVTLIPLTINGLGLLEGTAMVLFKRIGIEPELSFLAFFLSRLIAMVFGAIVILFATWSKKRITPAEDLQVSCP